MSNHGVCPSCRAALPTGALFCPTCGAGLSSAGAPTQVLEEHGRPRAGGTKAVIAAIMQRYSAFLKDDAIFFAPMIPPKKLQNAIQTYAPLAPDETIWLLIDDSIFGSAKDGLILTEQHLFARRDPFSQPLFFPLAQISSVRVRREDSSHMLCINDVDCIYLSFGAERMVYLFGELLLEVVSVLRPPSTSTDAAEVLRALRVLHQAGLLSNEELEAKRRSYLVRNE